MASMEFRSTRKAISRAKTTAEIKIAIEKLDEQYRSNPKAMREQDWSKMVKVIIKAIKRIERERLYD